RNGALRTGQRRSVQQASGRCRGCFAGKGQRVLPGPRRRQIPAGRGTGRRGYEDFFYNHKKPKYLSFKIQRIRYSDDFTKANVLVLDEQNVMMPGIEEKPMKVPTPSTWKVVDGTWFWYVDQASLNNTPMGKGTPGPGTGSREELPAVPTSIGFVM